MSVPEAEGPGLVEIRPGRELSVYHLQHPDPEAMTVFLAHGACATWKQFRAVIGELRRDYTVVTYDVYGCGDSPKPVGPKEAYSTQVRSCASPSLVCVHIYM